MHFVFIVVMNIFHVCRVELRVMMNWSSIGMLVPHIHSNDNQIPESSKSHNALLRK